MALVRFPGDNSVDNLDGATFLRETSHVKQPAPARHMPRPAAPGPAPAHPSPGPPPPSAPPDLGATGPAALARPSTVAEVYHGAGRALRRHYLITCVLDWYRTRRLITARQWAAGHRLREDWHLAWLDQRVIGSYGERTSGSSREPTGRQIAAHRRLNRALDAVSAPAQGVLIAVCVDDAWAGRTLPSLRLGLVALAKHYRL